MKSIPLLLTGLVIAAGAALAPAGVYAQTGTVYGIVTDAQSGDPLPGAAVRVAGTSLATATSLDGEYQINLVPSGTQTLEISYIGYRTEHIEVVVPQGERLERNIEVHPEIVQGEEVVVTAQAEGQAAAINQQIASNTIVNVVSAARIQELPDANAAESVGRLPGISILRDAGEGQKVVVRGLSPKYTSITVNGVPIPATDAQNRSVNLSMISPDMLAGIEVYKALTPDQDADAIGGIVNLTLKGAPAGLHYGIDAQTGYNSQQTAFGQYKGHASVSNRFLGSRLGVLGTASLERADRGSDVFNAGYSVVREAIEGEDRAPIRVDQVALMDRLETRNRYGASIMLDYDLPHGHILMSNFGSLLNRDELRREKQYNLGQFRTWYDFRDRDVTVSILSNSLRGDHTILGSSFQWQVSRSASLQDIPYYNHIRFQELGAFNDAILEDQKGPTYVPEAAHNNLGETFIYDGQDTHERAWERDRAARADLKIPLAFGRHVSGFFKFGGKYRSKVRTHDEDERTERFDEGSGTNAIESAFPERDFTLTQNGFVQIYNFLTEGYRPKNFLDGQYAFGAVLDPGMLTQFYERLDSLYLFSPFADLQDYEYYEDIGAGYVMAELHITPRLMIMPGVRYEHASTKYNARQGYARSLESDNPEAFISDTTASNEYGLWFPMFHVRFHVTDWFDIRLARTSTLSRPDYTFLSPGRRISADAQRVERGNPLLRPAKATNYDVFFSFYSNRIGLFTIGGFYKQLDDLVYERDKTVLSPSDDDVPRDTRGFSLVEPVNNENATTVKGIEVEWQTHFTYLPAPFDGIVLNANYSRILSDTQYPQVLLIRQPFPKPVIVVDTFRVGRMPNQADYIANVSLGYDKGGFSGRVSMLFQGNSLNFIGDRFEVDGFTDDYLRWDASLLQRFSDNLSVFLNLTNFTDTPDLSYQQTAGFPTSEEYYGWAVDLGVRYKF